MNNKVSFCLYIKEDAFNNIDGIRDMIRAESERMLIIARRLSEAAVKSRCTFKFDLLLWSIPKKFDRANCSEEEAAIRDCGAKSTSSMTATCSGRQVENPKKKSGKKLGKTSAKASMPDEFSQFQQQCQVLFREHQDLFREYLVGPEANGSHIRVDIIDFSQFVTPDEKQYLDTIATSPGNILDLMKFKSFWLCNNGAYNYLQLDSSSIIRDYHGFYASTFGQQASNYQFLINVYSDVTRQFSINNKIIYASIHDQQFKKTLKKYYDEHIKNYAKKNKLDPLITADFRHEERLFLYSNAFIRALQVIELLDRDKFINFNASTDARDPFLITKYVVAKKQQSWSRSFGQDSPDDWLKDIKSEDGMIDLFAFNHLIKKHITPLSRLITMKPKHDILLRKYADINVERQYIRSFLEAAYGSNPTEASEFIDKTKIFVDSYNPREGQVLSLSNQLAQSLFDLLTSIQADLNQKFSDDPRNSLLTETINSSIAVSGERDEFTKGIDSLCAIGEAGLTNAPETDINANESKPELVVECTDCSPELLSTGAGVFVSAILQEQQASPTNPVELIKMLSFDDLTSAPSVTSGPQVFDEVDSSSSQNLYSFGDKKLTRTAFFAQPITPDARKNGGNGNGERLWQANGTSTQGLGLLNSSSSKKNTGEKASSFAKGKSV